MLIRRPDDVKPSEVTPERLYHGRREFLAAAGIAGVGALAGALPGSRASAQEPRALGKPYGLQANDAPTP